METIINKGYQFKIVPTELQEGIFPEVVWLCP